MKSLLVLMSVVGAAMCQWGQPGLPQDTPEVAAAKAAHYAALARAGSPVPVAAHSWGVPSASGVPQDTPEVAAAKAAHFAAVAQVQGHQPQQQSWTPQQQSWAPQAQTWTSQYQSRWNGPVALPPGFDQNGAPLPVQDTPEVAAERARHFSLYSSGGHPSLAPVQPTWNAAPQWTPAPQWNAPAQPGLPQDTPEVAAAKAAHFAAHAQLAPASHGRWKRGIYAAAPAVAISTHSTAVVHPSPIVHATPLIRTTPYIHSIHTPVLHTAPLIRSAHVVHASPYLAHW